MKYTCGKPLEPGEKWAIVNVKEYFDRNKKEFGLSESSVQLTADALQMGISTIRRIMADYRRDPLLLNKLPKPKGRPNDSIDNSHEEVVRRFIRNANKSGQYITTSTIYDLILEREAKAIFHRATLTRMLDRWGFEFGKGKRSQHLKEKDETVALPSAKDKIWNGLIENQIPCDKNSLKAELVVALQKLSPLPIYEVDEMAPFKSRLQL